MLVRPACGYLNLAIEFLHPEAWGVKGVVPMLACAIDPVFLVGGHDRGTYGVVIPFVVVSDAEMTVENVDCRFTREIVDDCHDLRVDLLDCSNLMPLSMKK